MIISHKYKCIFIAIPKTGTHAIRNAMRPHLDENDTEQVSLFVQKKLPYEVLAKIPHGHITALEIRPYFEPEVWDSYFKFAIVRNPFDRFISYCAFIHGSNPAFLVNPEPFFYNTILNKNSDKQILFKPQADFVTDKNNELIVDFTGKQESMQESFNHVCAQTGIPISNLEVINSSKHKPYKEYYNSELIELVQKKYEKDTSLFNYSF